MTWPIHPFLAAAYSVLIIASSAGGELVVGADLVRPICVALGLAAGTWLASRAATADVDRRGLLTLIAIIALTTYGHWQRFFEAVRSLRWCGANEILLPVWVSAIGLTGIAAARPGRGNPSLTRILNVAGFLLLAVSGGQVVHTLLRDRPSAALPLVSSRARSTAEKPHFFLLVLDKYTGSGSLRSNYEYDNGPFESFLSDRGFVVVKGAHANYVHTFLALAAMLNWEYLDPSWPLPGPQEERWDLLYPFIENNRTVAAVKAAGYRFVFMPTSYAMTAQNRLADLQMPDPAKVTRELEIVWLRSTMLNGIMEVWCDHGRCPALFLPWASEAARSLDWKFEQLPSLAASSEPVFLLAHLTVPHEPYLYHGNCSHRAPYWPRRDDGADAARVKRSYVEQVQCLNRKLEKLVLDIDRTATRPVVIMLQSDHGHGRLGLDTPSAANTPPDKRAERLDIFAAYRLPGARGGLIGDSIGPINAVRSVMRHYFQVPLAPLPEASFWSATRRPYNLTPVR
jgi:hypothetical protein